MLKKIEGYALANEEGKFLSFEQVSHFGLETYSYESPDHATLWNSEAEAFQEGFNINKGIGKWEYQILPEDMPVSIVRVIKLIDIEEIKRFVFGDKS